MTTPLLLRIRGLHRAFGISKGKLRALASLGGGCLWPGSRKWYLRPVAEHVLQGLPLTSPFGAEPAAPMLRRADVLAWLGLTDRQLDHMLSHTDEGKLCHRNGGERRLYRRDAILALLLPLCPPEFRKP